MYKIIKLPKKLDTEEDRAMCRELISIVKEAEAKERKEQALKKAEEERTRKQEMKELEEFYKGLEEFNKRCNEKDGW